MHKCKFCNRETYSKKSNWIHESRCSENPNRYVQEPWNKGKTGVQDAWNKGKKIAGHPQSEETKKKLSIAAKRRKLGGYVPGSGRGKKGWYCGIFCDSSWELAFVIWCLDHGKQISKNRSHRTYVFEGEEKKYIPDFLVDGRIVEIKGYRTKQWEAKLENNPDVEVLYKEEMKFIIDYVVQKHGRDYVNLYEGGATVLASGTVLKTV